MGELSVRLDVEGSDRVDIAGCCQTYHLSLLANPHMRYGLVLPQQFARTSLLERWRRIHHSGGCEGGYLRGGEGSGTEKTARHAPRKVEIRFLAK